MPPPPEVVEVARRTATGWEKDTLLLPVDKARERSWRWRRRLRHVREGLPRLGRRSLLGLVFLIAAVTIVGLWLPAARRPAELPTKLDARARLLAEAWLTRNFPRAAALSDPARAGPLLRWVNHNPPPDWAKHYDRRMCPITVTIARQDGQEAEVIVRMESLVGGGEGMELQQRWIVSKGTWYFAPNPPELPKWEGPPPLLVGDD